MRDGQLVLRIADDGVGLPPDTPSSGRGLRNMAARAQQLGGTLHVASGTERVTVVTLTLELVAKQRVA